MNRTVIVLAILVLIAIAATACGRTPVPSPSPVVLPTATALPRTPTTAPAATKAPTAAPTTAATTTGAQADPAAIDLRYTTMALNVQQMGELVEKWNGGNEVARAEATERMEQIEQLADYAWPAEMANGVKALKAAMGEMDKMLKAKDKAGAGKAYDALNEAFDEVAHPFFGKWMPSMMSGGKVMNDQPSVQATYLGMAFNMDLANKMMARWKKGEDAARAEMGEVIERMNSQVGMVTWPADLSKGVTTFKGSLETLEKAVKAKDMQGAQTALADAAELFDGVAHPYYGKFMASMMSMKMSDAPSLQAAFLDLALNTVGLEETLDEWKGGSNAAASEAGEKFERLDAAFDSVKWPDALTKSVTALKTSLAPVQAAVKAKDAAAAVKAFGDAEEAFDSVAHAYYKWLASVK